MLAPEFCSLFSKLFLVTKALIRPALSSSLPGTTLQFMPTSKVSVRQYNTIFQIGLFTYRTSILPDTAFALHLREGCCTRTWTTNMEVRRVSILEICIVPASANSYFLLFVSYSTKMHRSIWVSIPSEEYPKRGPYGLFGSQKRHCALPKPRNVIQTLKILPQKKDVLRYSVPHRLRSDNVLENLWNNRENPDHSLARSAICFISVAWYNTLLFAVYRADLPLLSIAYWLCTEKLTIRLHSFCFSSSIRVSSHGKYQPWRQELLLDFAARTDLGFHCTCRKCSVISQGSAKSFKMQYHKYSNFDIFSLWKPSENSISNHTKAFPQGFIRSRASVSSINTFLLPWFPTSWSPLIGLSLSPDSQNRPSVVSRVLLK